MSANFFLKVQNDACVNLFQVFVSICVRCSRSRHLWSKTPCCSHSPWSEDEALSSQVSFVRWKLSPPFLLSSLPSSPVSPFPVVSALPNCFGALSFWTRGRSLSSLKLRRRRLRSVESDSHVNDAERRRPRILAVVGC